MRGFQDNEAVLLTGYDVIVSPPPQGFMRLFMTDSERTSMLSWSIVLFYLRCMLSEITRFYCKPDMTSSSVHCQGALHALFHSGFYKSDRDFLIAIHSNFLATHGFRDNEVALPTEYDAIVRPPLKGASPDFRKGFWKNENDFMILLHSPFNLQYMFSEIMKIYCQPDMTSSWFLC